MVPTPRTKLPVVGQRPSHARVHQADDGPRALRQPGTTTAPTPLETTSRDVRSWPAPSPSSSGPGTRLRVCHVEPQANIVCFRHIPAGATDDLDGYTAPPRGDRPRRRLLHRQDQPADRHLPPNHDHERANLGRRSPRTPGSNPSCSPIDRRLNDRIVAWASLLSHDAFARAAGRVVIVNGSRLAAEVPI